MSLQHAGPGAGNRDERLGEAVEAYLELAESGRAPEPEAFAASYPDLADELREALDGLALVQGLVGSGVGPGGVGARRLEAGYRVAGYRIVRELGRGGMGVVYEAVHVDLDRPVALKILGGHATPGSSGRRRFLNEAKTAAGLHHTHIVPVFDVGQVGGLCYYAMQRIEGSGLDRVVRALRRDRLTASGSPSGRSPAPTASATAVRGDDESASGLLSVPGLSGGTTATAWAKGAPGLPRRDDHPPPFVPPTGSEYYRWVARVGLQAAEALAYAHRRGVVHRDVKPSNLLVDARGVVWVADFGLARRLEDPGQTRGDALIGTPRYMSPEQAEGRPVDGATDVYSLGATLYELLTLRPPFDGQSAAELVRQIADRDPPPPRRFARRLPRDLETIVLKAMAKRPGDRYESAADLAEDLGRFLAFEPVTARRISPIGRSWRLARRHPAATIVSTLAAAAILATATVAYVRIANALERALRSELALAESLKDQRAATLAQQVARSRELLSHLPVLRASTKPRRRDEGRAKLVEAALLAPDEAMRLLLRDEAVELLTARDVEDRPALPIGRVRGLLPLDVTEDGPSGRVAALSEDGETLTLWDVEGRRAPVAHQLRPPRPADEPGDPAPRRGGGPAPWPTLALVGSSIAVPNPDGPGILLVDPRSGVLTPLTLGGAEVSGLLAPSGPRRRLVTFESIRREEPGRAEPGDGPGRGFRNMPWGVRIRLWDLDGSPVPLATLDEQRFDPGGNARFQMPLVELDPEGETIVFGRAPASTVTIFDAEGGDRLAEFDAGMALSALAAGPDGLIATAGDGRVLLWEVDSLSGDRPILLPGLIEPRGDIRRLRFSPSGRLLAALGMYTGVELWDPAANAPVAVVSTQGPVLDLAFADGRTLLVASGAVAEVWSIAEPIGRVGFEFAADAPPRSPAFGPDGLLVMPLFADAPRLWHPGQCPTRARPWERPEAVGAAVAFGPDGLLLAFGPDGLARFDAPTDAPPVDFLPWPEADDPAPTTRSVRLLARSPDRRALLIFREVEPRPDAARGRDREPPEPGPGPGPGPGRRQGGELWLWRADDADGGPGRLTRLNPRGPGAHPDIPRSPFMPAAALDLDGRRLFFLDRGLHAWSLDGERPRPLPVPYRDPVRSLAISPDGRLLALGGLAAEVTLVSTDTFRVVAQLPAPDPGEPRWVFAVAFSPDGSSIAVGDGGGALHLWSLGDPRSPEPRRLLRLPGRRNQLVGLTFSPDGRRLASVDVRPSEDRVVEVWDLASLRSELTDLGLGW